MKKMKLSMVFGQKELIHIWYPENSYNLNEKEKIAKRVRSAFSYKLFEPNVDKLKEKDYVVAHIVPKLAAGVFIRSKEGMFSPGTENLVTLLHQCGSQTFELDKEGIFKVLDTETVKRDSAR